MFGVSILALIQMVQTDITQMVCRRRYCNWKLDNRQQDLNDLRTLSHFSATMSSSATWSPNPSAWRPPMFESMDVQVIDGHIVMRLKISTNETRKHFLSNHLTSKHYNLLRKMAQHAKILPQNVYPSSTRCVQQQQSLNSRTTAHFQPFFDANETGSAAALPYIPSTAR